jgi:hypothetical protein
MKQSIRILAAVSFALLLGGCCTSPMKPCGDCQMFAHNIYFTLIDASDAKKAELAAECHRYLKDHPGVVFFAAGTLSQIHDHPLNVRDFDVSLHIVFDSVAALDVYQTAPDHLTFIERNQANWKQIRVFDSLVD